MAIQRTIEPWSALLNEAREDGRLVREAREGPGPAKLVDPPAELHPDVLAALARLGVDQLYSHQAEAIYAATAGPTIITTGTASGKSMCFNLPTLHILCEQARARALYLYPTKALAQDQARALASFGLSKRVRPAIYDGDTPREARAQIRKSANVVLTNPDMLHVGILPNHAAWADLFANLAIVVIDEAHVYRGVFGSHVANVLRRLRRVAARYNTYPIFLLTSEHRAADPLQDPEADQPAEARGQAAQPRAEGEQRQADLEDRPAADSVGEGTGEHEQGGQRDGVRGDHPLQAGHAGVQVAADGRQPDHHDRVVQADHEEAQAADGQHDGAARAHGAGGDRARAGIGVLFGIPGQLEAQDRYRGPFW